MYMRTRSRVCEHAFVHLCLCVCVRAYRIQHRVQILMETKFTENTHTQQSGNM